MVGVTQDATSGKYVPANSTEMDTALAAAGLSFTAASIWNFQEAASPIADGVGGFNLTASGSPSFQQSVTGWSRLAVTYADASGGGLTNTAAGLPDTASASFLVIAYVKFPGVTPAGTRNIIQIGTDAATRGDIAMLNTSVARGFINGNSASGSSNPCTGVVRPCAVRLNRTAGTFVVFTDQDKMTPAFSAGITGKGVRFNGSGVSSSLAGGELWGAAFHGAQAEWSDEQLKTFLQQLGWTISWS